MIFGMMPLALALGAGAEMRQGMAIVVVAGLFSSTVLTLVLVPVVYSYVDGLRDRIPALFAKVAWASWFPWKRGTPGVAADPVPHQ